MDHSQIAFLIKLQVKKKKIVGLIKLLIINLIKMIVHKHKDETFFQYYNKS